jgi:glycosyltransferase involved in cell wall biosynthesis
MITLDVLDLWPDLFVNPLSPYFRWFGRAVFAPYFYMCRVAFCRADRITSVSKSYAAWALKRAGRDDTENFSYFYLGAGDQLDAYNKDKARNKMTCLFAGQLGFNYDVETIVSAANILEKSGDQNIEFLIAGDGYKRDRLKEMAKELKNIEFLGWVPFGELSRLAENCHVGLNCYTRDATQSVPTKLFDYLSLGLFVVNSLPGESSLLLADAGIGVDYKPGDPESLAQVLRGLSLKLEEICFMGEIALRTFNEQFRADVIYDDMIRSLVEGVVT